MGNEIDFFARFVSSALKDVDEIADILKKLLTKVNDDSSREVLNYLNETGVENLRMTSVKDMFAKDFTKELELRNIPYTMLRDTKTGQPIIVTRDIDDTAVKESKESVYLKNRSVSEVSIDTLVKNNLSVSGDMKELNCIKDITDTQMYLMKQIITEKRGIFSKKLNEKGNYDVYFYKDEKNAKIVGGAYLQSKAQLVGELGDITRIQIENNKKMNQYLLDVANEKLKNHEDFVIVSATNPNKMISVSPTEVNHIFKNDDGKEIYFRNSQGNRGQLIKGIFLDLETLKNPVLISKADYEANKDNEPQLRRCLAEQKKEQVKDAGLITVEKERKELAEKERLARELVEKKMMMENFDNSEFAINLYDGNISFSEFLMQNANNLEMNVEHNERLQRMIDIADLLDNSSQEDKDKILSYLNDTHVMINDYASNNFVHTYQPTKDDLSNDFDDFILTSSEPIPNVEVQTKTRDNDEREI